MRTAYVTSHALLQAAVCQPSNPRQQGAALIVSLLMLVAVMLLGISAAQIALQGERMSRNDRDRQIAFQAAEAALIDAETDIENSTHANSRSHIFAADSALGFVAGCGAGNGGTSMGLCSQADEGVTPVWQTIDFLNDTEQAKSVPYGRFTGQHFQTGEGTLPRKTPRYIIELMRYTGKGVDAGEGKITYFYRITAMGFGTRDSTQVILQTFYKKGSQ